MSKEISLPEKLYPLTNPKRYNILYGGRGSGKSEGIARLLIIRALQSQRRILCCREFQVSIPLQNISDVIEAEVNRDDVTSR